MRILPISLSVLMIFTPAYSAYASMLPTKGQVVQIGKKGGALIKTGAGKVVKVGAIGLGIEGSRAVWAWCKNNQKKCKDYAGDAFEIVCDLTSCDVERKEEDPEASGNCYSADGFKGRTPYLACRKALDAHYKDSAIEELRPIKHGPHDVHDCIFKPYNVQIIVYKDDPKNCEYLPKDNTLNQQDLNNLAKKIAEQMDDDDIKNYYNTDYDDITINNYHYYGDDIDNQTNIDNQCQNNSCNEISKEIEKDIANKKYDIDDVNEKNCTIEESTGKYIACNMTIKEDDENTQTPPKDDKDQTIPKKEDDDKPAFCNTSDFFKEACEYFDWVDDEPSEKQDKKVNIEDEEEEKLNKNRINLDEGCPPDQHISVSMPWGYSTTIEFTYKPYCDFARDLKPYMTATGAIVSMYIVGSCGRRL